LHRFIDGSIVYSSLPVKPYCVLAASTKTFTADQLEVIWGNAEHKLEDSKWKLSFASQYDQVKWKVPETITLSDVKSVTFHVADQKGSVTLKVYNQSPNTTAAYRLHT